jgi:hypothetical protein
MDLGVCSIFGRNEAACDILTVSFGFLCFSKFPYRI